ncbi:MAG: 4'-phosphopantetheinyl transferase superfamily protein [Betaproteobacteria bacterium]|nr:4'-phosphopantetheinyl transferase superfamily protein [Betaproteobacteria bacterium]
MRLEQNGRAGNAGPQRLPAPFATTIPGLELWLCPLAAPVEALPAFVSTLSAAERARTERLGNEALRARYVVGRATLRMLLASALGLTPAGVPLRHGPRGRPEVDLPGHVLDFNVSHTRDVALIAVLCDAPTTTRIGVDIEHLDREVGADRLARRYLTPSERTDFEVLPADARRRRFLRLWTCKEAMSKATGDGLRAPMRQLDVAVEDGLRLVGGPPPYAPPDWRLEAVALADDYVATVALWSGAPGFDRYRDTPTNL